MYSVVMELLLEVSASAFDQTIWEGVDRPIDRDEVYRAIREGEFMCAPYESTARWSREDHVRRIAYLVVHPDPTPVEIEMDSYGYPIIYDGNHRIAAAVCRGDLTILADISGFIDHIPSLLGDQDQRKKECERW